MQEPKPPNRRQRTANQMVIQSEAFICSNFCQRLYTHLITLVSILLAALPQKSALKIEPISTRMISIRHQSSRNFSTPTYCQSATIGLFAFVLCLFTTKNKKEFRIATVAIFRCYLYAAVFPQMSPPPPTKNGARLRTTKHNGRFYSFINKISVHGSRRFICTGSCSATHGLLLS